MTGSSEYQFEGFNLARDIVHQTAVEHGWWEPQVVCLDESHNEVMAPRTFGELIALVHSEASEALEEFRAGHSPDETYFPDAGAHGPVPSSPKLAEVWAGSYGWKPEGVPSELADIIIRVLDMCGYYGIDIEAAMLVKARYNETRPYRHGEKAL